MLDKLKSLWGVKDIRNSVLFVLGVVIVYRIAAHIPVPGVNAQALKSLFESNQILGLLDLFSGGGISRFSVVALGVAPYITASIIFQLLTMVVPRLEDLSKEPGGYAKINTWTRWLTVPLAMFQGFSLLSLLRQQSQVDLIPALSIWQTLLAMVTITAGTVFLMWLGEIISEKHVGNGVSLIIFVGIVGALPGVIQRFLSTYDGSQWLTIVVFAIVTVITIAAVVLINEGTRNIPVSYARHIRGGAGPVNNYLPLKVNAAGVIPIIFAVSLLLFPPLIAQFTSQAKAQWLVEVSRWVIATFQNQTFYGITYFVLVFAFTYFYTSVVFHPEQIAENLQKQGGFIPGIRPGEQTKTYLSQVSSHILLAGALFLGLIAVMPVVIQAITGSQNLIIGGTSILIVVSVVVEAIKQVEAQMTMRDYDI
ncbi:MAG: preprotein translocase subunit SecY [Janthinobacterium sp.]|jgi:preprotein translocase subunit SecY